MDRKELAKKHCVPCEGGMEPLKESKARLYMRDLPGWELSGGHEIGKIFEFKNFKDALAFVVKIGALAENEGHHPDLFLSWGEVGVTLSTHAIGGLSENDFILAAKIEELLKRKMSRPPVR